MRRIGGLLVLGMSGCLLPSLPLAVVVAVVVVAVVVARAPLGSLGSGPNRGIPSPQKS